MDTTLLAGLFVCCGCGPGAATTSSSGAMSTTAAVGSSGAELPTASSANTPNGLDSTGEQTPQATGDTGPVATTGGTTAEPACPESEVVLASFCVEPNTDIDAQCVVSEVDTLAGVSEFLLDCQGQAVTVEVIKDDGSLVPGLPTGAVVRLQYVTDVIQWTNRWLAISTVAAQPTHLLFGAVASSSLDPPGTSIDDLFASGDGEPQLSLSDGGCAPRITGCGPLQRQILQVVLQGRPPGAVLDGSTRYVERAAGGYEVALNSAVDARGAAGCDDAMPAWVQFTLVAFGGD